MRLILASRSERRAGMLQAAGYAFEQADPPFIDPPTPPTLPGSAGSDGAAAHAVDLARRKAESLRPRVEGDALILAADTICIAADRRLVGTPESREEAGTIVRSFVGLAHEVVTGVAAVRTSDERWWHESDVATVTWGLISDETIEQYLASDEWRGKAGGYNLFDRQREGWSIHVDGDPTTVVGLPMDRLRRIFEQAGIAPEAAVR